MQIELIGPDALKDTGDLDEWLRRERLPGLLVERQSVARPETQGVEWLPVLVAILSTPAITKMGVELVKSIHTWIKVRKPRVKIVIALDANRKLTLDAENIANVDEIETRMLHLLKSASQN